jgi:hypothetical protein
MSIGTLLKKVFALCCPSESSSRFRPKNNIKVAQKKNGLKSNNVLNLMKSGKERVSGKIKGLHQPIGGHCSKDRLKNQKSAQDRYSYWTLQTKTHAQ